MKRPPLLLTALCLCLALAACARPPRGLDRRTAEAPPSDAATATPTPQQESEEFSKYNAYADLAVLLYDRTDTAVSAYIKQFGRGDEPYLEKGFSGAEIPRMEELNAALERAAACSGQLPEYQDTDIALEGLEPVLREYAAAFDAAARYYGEGGYESDGFAAAQGYHDRIIGGYGELKTRVNAFLGAFSAVAEGQDARQLARLWEAGQTARYYALLALSSAREMQELLVKDGVTAANLAVCDTGSLAPLYDAFSQARDRYDGEADGYAQALAELDAAGAELIGSALEGREFSAEEQEDARRVYGTPECFDRLVTELIWAYNAWVA